MAFRNPKSICFESGRQTLRGGLSAVLLLALLIQPVLSQIPQSDVPPPPPPANGQGPGRRGRASFSMTMSQVIVNVSVVDKAGKPVENLTRDDFELYEDGKLQTVRTSEFQRLGTQP